MAWLVEFLKAWYSSREMLDETERLAARFAELVKVGEKALATETLDYRQYLADAMDERFRGSATDRLVNDCLDAGDTDRVRGIVRSDGLTQLCPATILRLTNGGLVTAPQATSEITRRQQWMAHLGNNSGFDSIVDVLDPKVVPLHAHPDLWFGRAAALHGIGRDEEALEDLEMCARSFPERTQEVLLKAEVLFNLHRFREAISVLTPRADEFALEPRAQILLASSSAILGDFDVAIAVCEAALARQETPEWRQFHETLLASRHSFNKPLHHFILLVAFGSFDEARRLWHDKIGILPAAEIVAGLGALIDRDKVRLFRTLIRESKLDDELLPLVVAMDYFETGDRSPLEKLSSEIRPIAEEIVAELRKKLPAPPERSMHKAHT
jgi:tetratricopeptide (TPR) repeat protein